MSTEQATSLALTGDWLNASPTLTNAGNISVFQNNASGYYWSGYWYPYYQPIWPSFPIEIFRPIKLTMAEVERLRVAAKKDKDLKKTLEKFTDHIEVIVDFDKKD